MPERSYPTTPYNFCGLSLEYSSLENSRVLILPVPYEQTTSYQGGTRNGPAAILAASRYLELYDEELDRELHAVGIHTLPELEPHMAGPEQMVRRIQEAVSPLLEGGRMVVLLGGEHSCSVGAVSAYGERYPQLSVLHLDAHADLRDSYQDTPYSHACTMRRIVEHVPAVHVGLRSLSLEEMDLIRRERLPVIFAREVLQGKGWQEKVLAHLSPEVYLTIDLDVLDPSIMPSVGTPEPGGLLWEPVVGLIREVARQKRIVGFDVMELAPLPGLVAPDFLAAKLVYKVIGYSTEAYSSWLLGIIRKVRT